jgi:hypothetical protein
VNKRLDHVLKFAVELQGMEVQELRRGPYLAVVEIERRRQLIQNTSSECSESKQGEKPSPLIAAILAYFDRCVLNVANVLSASFVFDL